MGDKIIFILAFLVILLQKTNVNAIEEHYNPVETTKPSVNDPPENLIYNQSSRHGSDHNENYPKNLSRVKRQYSYGQRGRYYPLPIIVGGFGYPGFGPRGFGGRGFGGRAIAGRGFGGRGIGGRGIGGRGIGGRGIGGRGGGGGGHGGGRG